MARRDAALPVSSDELSARVSIEPKSELEVLEIRGRSDSARRAARLADGVVEVLLPRLPRREATPPLVE